MTVAELRDLLDSQPGTARVVFFTDHTNVVEVVAVESVLYDRPCRQVLNVSCVREGTATAVLLRGR